MDYTQVNVEEKRDNYLRPIAREGEQQFACILRNRSGMDAGCIDYGLRNVSHLCEGDKQDIVDTAYVLYQSICEQTGKTPRNLK